ncbi:MAG: c-type cytochrome [Bryobacteraceae bacterium]
MKLTMLVLFLSFAALGQEPGPPPPGAPGGPPPGGRMREMGPPKNLKILPPEHLMERMRAFREALGVRCDFCHVQGDFASDEKPHKEIARKMILMTREINTKFPGGGEKMHVTCYTCHRGAEEPATAPGTAPVPNHAEHEPHQP